VISVTGGPGTAGRPRAALWAVGRAVTSAFTPLGERLPGAGEGLRAPGAHRSP